MKTSTDRILTTHTGSLPRPKPLLDLILGREKGDTIDAATFEAATVKAVDEVVALQVKNGVDIVSDGEMSKPSYTTYIRHRVEGIAHDPRAAEKGRDIMLGRDLMAHPDFGNTRRNFSASPFPGCVGPLKYKDRSALDRDFAHLKAAAAKCKPADVFMTAPSPGILTRFIINLHYKTEEAYVEALAEMMKTEYRAIVEAGFVLQIDCPDLGSCRNNQYRDLTDDEFRSKIAERNIAALNGAIEGLPADRMRLHICWGNYEGPHSFDLPLLKIIDIASRRRCRRSASRPPIRATTTSGKTSRPSRFRRQDPDSRRDRLDDEFHRASEARGAAHRPLRRHRRPRAGARGRRLRLRHRGPHRPDRRRQHRLGQAQGARRRRGDRERAAVGLEGGMMTIGKFFCSPPTHRCRLLLLPTVTSADAARSKRAKITVHSKRWHGYGFLPGYRPSLAERQRRADHGFRLLQPDRERRYFDYYGNVRYGWGRPGFYRGRYNGGSFGPCSASVRRSA